MAVDAPSNPSLESLEQDLSQKVKNVNNFVSWRSAVKCLEQYRAARSKIEKMNNEPDVAGADAIHVLSAWPMRMSEDERVKFFLDIAPKIQDNELLHNMLITVTSGITQANALTMFLFSAMLVEKKMNFMEMDAAVKLGSIARVRDIYQHPGCREALMAIATLAQYEVLQKGKVAI